MLSRLEGGGGRDFSRCRWGEKSEKGGIEKRGNVKEKGEKTEDKGEIEVKKVNKFKRGKMGA